MSTCIENCCVYNGNAYAEPRNLSLHCEVVENNRRRGRERKMRVFNAE